MLSHEGLKPHYGKVTWLFVSRNFKNDEKDREAARTHDRFGITSWPHCVLFDPRDDRVLARLPRNLKGFVAGLDRHAKAVPAANAAARLAADWVKEAIGHRGKGRKRDAERLIAEVAAQEDDAGIWLHARELQREWSGKERKPAAMLDDPDVRERAIAVETIAQLTPGRQKLLGERVREILVDPDEHLIVRLRALRLVGANQPKFIRAEAETLLGIENDPFRFEVLTVLAKKSAPELTPLFLRLYREAGKAIPSSNPNVLRIHAANCLTTSGDARAVPALAEFARQGNTRNGLTGTVLEALAAIGKRGSPSLRAEIAGILCASFPPALEDTDEGTDDRAMARVLYSCKRVRTALAVVATRVPELPASWSRSDREAYLAGLKSVRARR